MVHYDARALGRMMARQRLSTRQLARRAGVERGTVMMLKRRRTAPNARTLAKLASALGVTPNDFFTTHARA